jgi:predicted small secreted protein
MDKKGGLMLRKSLVFFILIALLGLLGLTGCQTAKGATTGIGLTAEGAGKDATGLGAAIGKLDQWIRDNMW